MSHEVEKQQLIAKMAERLSPEEQAKVKTQPKPKYVPQQARGFKLRYNVGTITINTDVKIKKLEAPKATDVFEENIDTGNPVKLSPYDKGTGNMLPAGYGFKKVDSITKQPVFDNKIRLVQLKPDPNNPIGFSKTEVSKFSKTDEIDITDTELVPRSIINDWLIETEYELFGVGAELYKLAKDMADKKMVGIIKEFNLTESKDTYRAFIVPSQVILEDRFYITIKLAKRRRESIIKAWLSSKDTVESTPKKSKIKTGAKIEVSLDEL